MDEDNNMSNSPSRESIIASVSSVCKGCCISEIKYFKDPREILEDFDFTCELLNIYMTTYDISILKNCPCCSCLIKMVCFEECDRYKDYKVDILATFESNHFEVITKK